MTKNDELLDIDINIGKQYDVVKWFITCKTNIYNEILKVHVNENETLGDILNKDKDKARRLCSNENYIGVYLDDEHFDELVNIYYKIKHDKSKRI